MTETELAAFLRGLAPVIRDQIVKEVEAHVGVLHERLVSVERRASVEDALATDLTALRAQVAALTTDSDAKPHVRFCGVWDAGKTYRPGDATVRSGSLWICTSEPVGTPGHDFNGWQLAVKRGAAS